MNAYLQHVYKHEYVETQHSNRSKAVEKQTLARGVTPFGFNAVRKYSCSVSSVKEAFYSFHLGSSIGWQFRSALQH